MTRIAALLSAVTVGVLCCVSEVGAANFELTSIVSFDSTNGANPSSLIPGRDGRLYGTTQSGRSAGNNNDTVWGTIFALGDSGSVDLLYRLSTPNSASKGSFPKAGLASRDYDGSLFGTASSGGQFAQGTIFKLSSAGTLLGDLVNFDGTNGAAPEAALIEAPDGGFYGTTRRGGAFGFGTIFRLTFNGRLSLLHSFGNGLEGAFPQSELVQAGNGRFYGTTTQGGLNNAGTVYAFDSSGWFQTVYSFTGGNDGYYPAAALVQGEDGRLYGTTVYGGNFHPEDGGDGTVFVIGRDDTFTSLFSFNRSNGCFPKARFLRGRDGMLYATTYQGGASIGNPRSIGGLGFGTVFRIGGSGSVETLHSFGEIGSQTPIDGAYPQSPLIESGGTFYGSTSRGGAFDFGTVYKLHPASSNSLAPSIVSVVQVGQNVVIRWTAMPGRTYQIQFRENWMESGWTGSGGIVGTNASMLATIPIESGAGKFFRLALLP